MYIDHARKRERETFSGIALEKRADEWEGRGGMKGLNIFFFSIRKRFFKD